MKLASRASMVAAMSSSCGSVSVFNGATRDLAITNEVKCCVEEGQLRLTLLCCHLRRRVALRDRVVLLGQESTVGKELHVQLLSWICVAIQDHFC